MPPATAKSARRPTAKPAPKARRAEGPKGATRKAKAENLRSRGENPFANTERFLRAAVFGSIVWAVLSTGLMTLAAVMYNLISDVVGGVEIVVLEESLLPLAVPANPPAPRRWTPAPPNGAKTEPSVVADTPTEEVPAI